MGTAEYDTQQLVITSCIITYGNAADTALTEMIRDEIETMWNEPKAVLFIEGYELLIRFKITAEYQPGISPVDIYQNLIPAIIISVSRSLPTVISLLWMDWAATLVILNWKIFIRVPPL